MIFQHPTEIYRPSATARLVSLAIPGTRIFVKENAADERELREICDDPLRRPYLVFPAPEAPEVGELVRSLNSPTVPSFLLLDGSWRQVRRMRSRKLWLANLPVVALRPVSASAYRIRRQSHEGNLSTVEAAALLLSRVEDDPAKYGHLLELLDLMVTRTLALRGLGRDGEPIHSRRSADTLG